LGGVALAAAVDGRAFEVEPRGECRGVGLVGDDADRAGLRAGAVQRALRAGERPDACNVVDANVERTLDGRDRLLVEINADARQGAGVIRVLATRHAAEVHRGRARAEGLV